MRKDSVICLRAARLSLWISNQSPHVLLEPLRDSVCFSVSLQAACSALDLSETTTCDWPDHGFEPCWVHGGRTQLQIRTVPSGKISVQTSKQCDHLSLIVLCVWGGRGVTSREIRRGKELEWDTDPEECWDMLAEDYGTGWSEKKIRQKTFIMCRLPLIFFSKYLEGLFCHYGMTEHRSSREDERNEKSNWLRDIGFFFTRQRKSSWWCLIVNIKFNSISSLLQRTLSICVQLWSQGVMTLIYCVSACCT